VVVETAEAMVEVGTVEVVREVETAAAVTVVATVVAVTVAEMAHLQPAKLDVANRRTGRSHQGCCSATQYSMVMIGPPAMWQSIRQLTGLLTH
jgi:hypothetical protein